MSYKKDNPIKAPASYSDISTNFSRNAVTGDVVRLLESDAVKRSIKNLVVTNKYERLLNPTLGAGLISLLFEQMSPLITITIRDQIATVIETYEPRANIETLDVIPDYDRQSYYVSIVFTLRSTQQRANVEFFLDRIR
jgi:phage baseplate assembly protein W